MELILQTGMRFMIFLEEINAVYVQMYDFEYNLYTQKKAE